MAGDIGKIERTVYASEIPGINDDGTNYDSIYPDKVTAFPNMSSIPVKGKVPFKHNKSPQLMNTNIPYTDLTDDELLEGIIATSLYILSDKYNITPQMFIDSNDKTLPCNMYHFENEIVDIINDLIDAFGYSYDIYNAPFFAFSVAETLKRYAEDIAIRDQLLKEESSIDIDE